MIFQSALSFAGRLLSSSGGESLEEFIIHHLTNADKWHPFPGVSVPLISNLKAGGLDVSVTLHVLMLLIAGAILFLLFGLLYQKRVGQAPRGITNLLEVFVLFVRNELCINYLGEKDGKRLAPFFLNFFFLILILNLMGLIPLFSTATANVNVTGGFALITLSMMIVGGIVKNGPVGFIHLFLPPGVPKPLYVVLFPIEFLGMFIKPFALTMRLFANMLGGHIVIYSLLSLIMTFGWAGTPSVLLALFIYSLELLVAFIQAYIFTLLSAMFVGSMLHPAH